MINAVGIKFGQTLMEGLDLRWVIATDEDGSDLAVYGLPGSGDVLVYPANFIARRWQRKEADFLAQAYREIAESTNTIRWLNEQET